LAKTALKAMKEIAEFILKSSHLINTGDIDRALHLLMETYRMGKKVVICGAGRSGLVGKAFAMRLMHLGFSVYVLGETITPSVNKNDLLVAISGSGSTELIVAAARMAKRTGAKVLAFTSYRDSPLGEIADHVVFVPGRTKVSVERDYFARQILGLHEPLAPLGTLFENTTMALLDGLITELMKKLGKNEKDLKKRHANIELP